jgi:hypothetical protein
VDDTTAPSSAAVVQSKPSTRCAATAVTATEIAVPTVASTAAAGTVGRIVDQRVVRPPSARMTSSAA